MRDTVSTAGVSENGEEMTNEDSRQENEQELGSIVWQSVTLESPFCEN